MTLPGTPQNLARLAHRLARDGAGIDHDQLGRSRLVLDDRESMRLEVTRPGFQLRLVEPAAEHQEPDAHSLPDQASAVRPAEGALGAGGGVGEL
ncbi:hypothetical protein Atep_03730 [Allochromatium tepidum]|uniref:Uncharacterized protein n=1 Tax=Allochromatium tepidum TaxID=553982 RepID=A0ABM7QIV8_9GAMM|nr:hypothetical protein Atep_03730 [Allochromatium tepidum]